MPTPRRPRPRAKRAYHHGNLRSDLIGAAVEIIGKHGTSALTLQALADRLAVSQAAPYRHFMNKEALLAAVAVDGFQALLDAVRAEMDAAGPDVVARYLAIGSGYMRFALSHRAHFQVMYGARPVEFPSREDELQDRHGLVHGPAKPCSRAPIGKIRSWDRSLVASGSTW